MTIPYLVIPDREMLSNETPLTEPVAPETVLTLTPFAELVTATDLIVTPLTVLSVRLYNCISK